MAGVSDCWTCHSIKKMKMKTVIPLIITLCGACLFFACVKEPASVNQFVKEGIDVSVRLLVHLPKASALADPSEEEGSNVENTIKTVRVVAFVSAGSTSTTFPAGSLVCNQLHPSATPYVEQRLNSGIRDFYVIANEPSSLTSALQSVRSLDDLKALKIDYDKQTPSTDHPFVMYAMLSNQTILSSEQINTPQRLDVEVGRIAAKVRFNITLDQTKVRPSIAGKPLVIEAVQIHRIADATHIVENVAYTPVTTLRSNVYIPEIQTDPKNWTFTSTLYLMERGFSTPEDKADTTKTTFLIFYGDREGVKCRYRINIGNQIKPVDGDLDFTVSRNTLYDIKGTIVDMGETDGVDIKVDVLPWNKVSLTDENGVVPVITKTIEDFTPCDGRGEFNVALSENAQWRVFIDNPSQFKIIGKTTHTGTGDTGGAFNITPISFPKSGAISTKVQIVVNGQVVDESEVKTAAPHYNWHTISNGVNSLYVMDCNLGANSPQSPGCLYKYGSLIGTNYMTPSFTITPSATNPITTYLIKEWEQVDSYYRTSVIEVGSATSWAGIPFQSAGGAMEQKNNPCPKGWRVLQPTDFTDIINARLSAEPVKSYGNFNKGSVSGRILTDDEGNKQYFPVMHYRSTTGVLSPNGEITSGYYWLNNAQGQYFTSKTTSVGSLLAANGAYARCVAEPFNIKSQPLTPFKEATEIEITPITQDPWTITIQSGGDWLQFSESEIWGHMQSGSMSGSGFKRFYLQPTKNNTFSDRTATLFVTNGKAYQTYLVTQSLPSATLMFASANHSPGSNIATSLGNGARNTFELCTMTTNPEKYIAAQFCFNLTVQELGRTPSTYQEMTWYLPSIEELVQTQNGSLRHSSTVNRIYTHQCIASGAVQGSGNMYNSYLVRCICK